MGAPTRYTEFGRAKYHATDCWVDGGPGLPPGVCRKCGTSTWAYFIHLLTALDKKAGS